MVVDELRGAGGWGSLLEANKKEIEIHHTVVDDKRRKLGLGTDRSSLISSPPFPVPVRTQSLCLVNH